ncbi:MAG: DUF3667 domain-containing protein [Terricaulis sp.]
MSGEMDAAGALATAGLAAGAIEGREAHKPGEGACLNCGAVLMGAYCSACGQASRPHRSLFHMIEEVLHGLFHFETKAWRTFPKLVLRPGTLTREYTYGKRARYISPLALFLFMIFLMFFVFSFVDANVLQFEVRQSREEIAADLTEARSDLAVAERELAEAQAAPEEQYTPGLAVRLATQGVRLAQAEVARQQRALARADAAASNASPEANNAPPKTWQEELSEKAKGGEVNVNTGFPELDARIVHSLENPDLALYKIQQAAYKYSFLLAPLSLPFLWLLFVWKRGLTLYDHTVFALYSLSFASLVFIVIALTAQAPQLAWAGGVLFGIGMPAHMFFHLKGAYALGWWSAIWRTLLLLFFAMIVLGLFVTLIVLLGLGG